MGRYGRLMTRAARRAASAATAVRGSVWEDFISLESQAGYDPSAGIGPASKYVGQDDGTVQWDRAQLPLDVAISQDRDPLPSTEDREGYYGANHFNYWASGIADLFEIRSWMTEHDAPLARYLDLGCATGRVARAFAAHTDATVLGCDINRKHVDWINARLSHGVVAFQNTSLPSLPLEDRSLDLVTAFSVFTHIESFDTAWLMEIRRVLCLGGIAWITFHGERTWDELQPNWPLYAGLKGHPSFMSDRNAHGKQLPPGRTIYRRADDRSYSANVFYDYDYVRTVWGSLLELVEVRPAIPAFQEVAVLRRTQ
jgi:SAM-dependent methyltransferase